MFGNTLNSSETTLIMLIGMSTVFFVLLLLTGILYLFRFIPQDDQPVVPATTTILIQNTVVTPLHKAIIMATILDSIGIEQKKNQVRIKSIRKIIS